MDFIPLMITMVVYCAIISSKFDRSNTFAVFLLAYSMTSLSQQSIGHIFGTVFEENALIASSSVIPLIFIFSNYEGNTVRDFDDFFSRISYLSSSKYCYDYIKTHFYGFGLCPEDQISSLMYRFVLDDDAYDRSWQSLIALFCVLRILTYICLKLKVNWDLIHIQIKRLKKMISK